MREITVDYAVAGLATWIASLSVDGHHRTTLDRTGPLPKLVMDVLSAIEDIANEIGLCRTSHTLYGDARAFDELAKVHGLRLADPCRPDVSSHRLITH